MTKVAPGVALRAQRHRNRRAVLTLAITGMLAAACGTGAATRAGSGPSASHQQPRSTADCDSVTTCYSPQQMKAAYGIVPLLLQGIDVRGQMVVLPELAEPEFRLPTIDICQDLVPSAPPWVVDFAHHGHDALTSALCG